MKKSLLSSTKLLQILCTVNEEELWLFEKWLSNSNKKNLARLVKELKPFYPKFDSPKLTKEKLFKRVLKGRRFSKTYFNNLFSETSIELEKFLIYRRLDKQETQKAHYLLEEFQTRNLENRFFRDSDEIIEKLESKEVKDWEDHIDLLKFYRRIYHHPTQSPRLNSGKVTLEKMESHLEISFLLEKAGIITEKIFRNRILKGSNFDVTEDLKIWRMLAVKSNHPAVLLYKKRFDYEPDNLLENYQAIKNQYFKNEHLLNIKDRKIHLISLINDFKYLRRKGLINIVDSLPLFKEGLRTSILLHNGVLNNATFVSILSASNTAGDFEYSLYFTKEYSKKLAPDARKDGEVYGVAHTLNKEGKFEKALDVLISHEFENKYFWLSAKFSCLQIYFEMLLQDETYEMLFFNYADAFEKWLYRKSDFSRSNMLSYIRFVQKSVKLAKVFLDVEFKESKLESVLKDTTNTQGINWLLVKKKEIYQRRKK